MLNYLAEIINTNQLFLALSDCVLSMQYTVYTGCTLSVVTYRCGWSWMTAHSLIALTGAPTMRQVAGCVTLGGVGVGAVVEGLRIQSQHQRYPTSP